MQGNERHLHCSRLHTRTKKEAGCGGRPIPETLCLFIISVKMTGFTTCICVLSAMAEKATMLQHTM